MTFTIRGHRVIIERSAVLCPCEEYQKEAVEAAVARQDRKTGDCYGNWGSFGTGRIFVAFQVDRQR